MCRPTHFLTLCRKGSMKWTTSYTSHGATPSLFILLKTPLKFLLLALRIVLGLKGSTRSRQSADLRQDQTQNQTLKKQPLLSPKIEPAPRTSGQRSLHQTAAFPRSIACT